MGRRDSLREERSESAGPQTAGVELTPLTYSTDYVNNSLGQLKILTSIRKAQEVNSDSLSTSILTIGAGRKRRFPRCPWLLFPPGPKAWDSRIHGRCPKPQANSPSIPGSND